MGEAVHDFYRAWRRHIEQAVADGRTARTTPRTAYAATVETLAALYDLPAAERYAGRVALASGADDGVRKRLKAWCRHGLLTSTAEDADTAHGLDRPPRRLYQFTDYGVALAELAVKARDAS